MAEPQSISSLFSDVLGPMSNAAAQLEADRALGKQLQQGSAATLFAPERARRLTGALGKATGIDTRSPEERQAEQNKKMISGVMRQAAQQFPDSRSQQLNAVARQLMQQNMPAQAAKFRDAAQAAELQEAKIYAERQKGFASEQSGLKSKAETTTEDATRQGQIGKIEAEEAAAQALADQRTAETGISQAAAPLERELLVAQTDAQRKGIDVDAARIRLIDKQVDTEEVNKRAAEQGITVDEARADLLQEEIVRYSSMTPLEILKANTEVAKNKSQYDLNVAKLGDVGKTAFERELENADFSPEQEKNLRQLRIKAQARSGGVQGFDIQGRSEEFAFDTYSNVIAEGQTAERPLETFQAFLGAIEDGAATGPLGSIDRWANSFGAVMGIESSKAKAAADDLVKVLTGVLTLAEAGSLKGALSDKDLQFLQESLPNFKQSKQGLKEVLIYLASSKAGQVYAGQRFEAKMGTEGFSPLNVRPAAASSALASVNQYSYLVNQRRLKKYQGKIPIPTVGEVKLWAEFTEQPEGTAEMIIESIKQREEAK